MLKQIETIKIVEDLSDSITVNDTLGNDSARLLGYKILQNKMSADKTRKSVLLTLHDLGIEVFDNESVAQYKETEQIRVLKKINKKADSAFIFGLCIMAALAITTIVLSIVFHPAFMTLIMVVLLGTGIICALHDDMTKTAIWKSTDICEYEYPIPEFVLDTAVRIKNKLPNCECLIDSLIVTRVVKDPFLKIVDQHKQEYYVEVWNEPRFKK